MALIEFHPIPEEAKILQVLYIDVLPMSTIVSGGTIEFFIPGSGNQYIDLKNTRLYVQCHITMGDGTPIPDFPADPQANVPVDAMVSVANNFLHTLFRQVEVFWGDKQVSSSGLFYPYKSYIDTLLNNDVGAKQSQLQAQGFHKDTPGYLEDPDIVFGSNEGLLERSKLFRASAKVDMEGPLYVDVFQQQTSMLLNGVDMRVKLQPSNTPFCFISANPQADYKIVLDKVLLRVCKVSANAHVFLENEKLLRKMTAKYPYMKAELTIRSIEQNQANLSVENVFQAKIPSKLCVALIPARCFNGTYQTNPFVFETADVNFLAAYVNGVSMPGSPFEPSYAGNAQNYIREYLSLFEATQKLGEDSGNDLGRLDYANGFTIYCFNIDPESQFTLKKQTGNFKVEIRLSQGAQKPYIVLLYALYPAIIEIDQSRNVITS